MVEVTTDQLRDALLGLEHSGSDRLIYNASFAVPNSILGQTRGQNSSGISFGVAQLDIGNNSYGQIAYTDILREALSSGTITEQQFNRLSSYNGVQRPDLHPELYPEFQSDRTLLTNDVFSRDFAHAVIDEYDGLYIDQTLGVEVNRFLTMVNNAHGPGTVFDPSHPDYPTALAAVISIANRTGDLRGSDQYFVNNRPTSLADVEARYNSIGGLGDHWHAVQIGGALIKFDGKLCFLGDTLIDMWPLASDLHPNPDGIYDQELVQSLIWQKPIEEVEVGDVVVSFDKNGNMVPGSVPRVFRNEAKILLNFHGTHVTPGHVYYRPDSKKAHKFETLIDVLRDDGVIQLRDRTLVRAATNVPLGDPRDGFVVAITGTRRADGSVVVKDQGRIRLGTRFIVEGKRTYAVADLIESGGGVVGEDGLIRVGDGDPMPFHWEFGEMLPKPEDYILACSGVTLEDIYKAGEWEDQPPHMPAPMVLDGGPVQPLPASAREAMPRNTPLSLDGATSVRASLNRKQRKALAAKAKKMSKTRLLN